MYGRGARQASYAIRQAADREFRRPVVRRDFREAVGFADRTKIEVPRGYSILVHF